MKNCSKKNSVLIIKFGGLGDFILSVEPFYSIRQHHKNENLILLTEKFYSEIAQKTGWFEKIITINRSLFYLSDKRQIKKKLIYQISKKFMIYKHQKEVVVISTYLMKIILSGLVL